MRTTSHVPATFDISAIGRHARILMVVGVVKAVADAAFKVLLCLLVLTFIVYLVKVTP